MARKRIETTSSRTAALTCLCRAISSLENNRCYRCDDNVARSLIPGFFRIPLAGRLFVKLFAVRGSYEYVIARTKYIDAVVKKSLSNQFTQILIFGAGFDTRALRFQDEAQHARIYELDAPATQEAKIGQYKKRRLDIPSNVVFVPIDFDIESPILKLDQAGFKRNERSLFLLEGVLMYLQPQSVDQTFGIIRELAGAGSEVVFDYVYASVLRHEGTCYGEKGFANSVSNAGEQWNFGIEQGEIGQFLSHHGFKLLEHLNAGELEAMYFKDQSGKIVGRINGTHCLTRALVMKDF